LPGRRRRGAVAPQPSPRPQGQPAANGKHTNPKRINIFTIFNALCQEVLTRELEPHPTMTIRNVEFINARTKVANCKINNSIETLFMFASIGKEGISSTLAKQVQKYKKEGTK
jgi:hypothetical protein